MENTQPQLISTAAYAPVSGENATPFSQQMVVLTKQDYIALKWEANYWRTQHARLVVRFVSSYQVLNRLVESRHFKIEGANG